MSIFRHPDGLIICGNWKSALVSRRWQVSRQFAAYPHLPPPTTIQLPHQVLWPYEGQVVIGERYDLVS